MSSSSREYSPDWLRNVQAAPAVYTLSSSSSSESESGPDDQLPISSVIRKTNNTTKHQLGLGHNKDSLWNLPSDSDPKEEQEDLEEEERDESSRKRPKLLQVPAQTKQENDDDVDDDVVERETTDEKQTGPPKPYISSSRLPLLLADKVQRSKVLVECQGESIDLSGDLGSVGRLVISDSPSATANQDMLFDLKGTIYKTTIMPSRTLCVVTFGQSEAKIEAIMNDFIQLKPQSNVYEAETMVEGTLEGFSFDSEDEGDKHASRQVDENNEGAEPQSNGKSRGKSEPAKRKGKTAVKKPAAKKVNKKKAPVAKKTKAKK